MYNRQQDFLYHFCTVSEAIGDQGEIEFPTTIVKESKVEEKKDGKDITWVNIALFCHFNIGQKSTEMPLYDY